MEYEVIRRFRDKYTGEIILPGATFICDETSRIEDLLSRSIIKPLSESGDRNAGKSKTSTKNKKRSV